MKKLLLSLLCLGMLIGCSPSSNDNKTDDTEFKDDSTKKEQSVNSKLIDTELYLTDGIKDFEEIEKILVDSGYCYDISDDNQLLLLNTDYDICNVIAFSKTDNAVMIIIPMNDFGNFTYIQDKTDDETSVIMGRNDELQWSLIDNVPLGDLTDTSDENLQDMLEIKKEYNSWSKKHDLSCFDLCMFFQIYYDVLINKKNTNIIDIKMDRLELKESKKTNTQENTTTSTPTKSTTLGEDNALKTAYDYLKYSGFSKKGLKEQLIYEGFSDSEATYAVENCGADWNEQADRVAKDYMEYSSFSKSGLIDQLEYEGFTKSQAEHGAKSVGY